MYHTLISECHDVLLSINIRVISNGTKPKHTVFLSTKQKPDIKSI